MAQVGEETVEETTYTLEGESGELIEVMVDEVDGKATDVYTYADYHADLPEALRLFEWFVERNPTFHHVREYHIPEAARLVKNLAIGLAR